MGSLVAEIQTNKDDGSFCQKGLLDAITFPFFYRDLEGVIIGCNKAFERLTGLDQEELIGKKIAEVPRLVNIEGLTKFDDVIRKTHRDQNYETGITLFGGNILYVGIRKSVYRNKEGIVIGMMTTIIDNSELKLMDNKLNEANEYINFLLTFLRKINLGIIIFDDALKIIEANKSFAEIAGEEAELLFQTVPGLTNVALKDFFPFTKIFTAFIDSNESTFIKEVEFNKKILQLNLLRMPRQNKFGLIIRDMSIPEIRSEELINKARHVKRKNLDSVQKIAYLLGENAAETEEILNAIVEFHKYDNKDPNHKH
jgi:PAS domain S-box-containing protein